VLAYLLEGNFYPGVGLGPVAQNIEGIIVEPGVETEAAHRWRTRQLVHESNKNVGLATERHLDRTKLTLYGRNIARRRIQKANAHKAMEVEICC
jgi:hypothetical protein